MRTHELKNRYMYARTSLRMHEFRLRMQEQVYIHKPDSTYANLRHFQVFSTRTQPKHVPTPSRVSGFHLNPSQSKTKAFLSIKTN